MPKHHTHPGNLNHWGHFLALWLRDISRKYQLRLVHLSEKDFISIMPISVRQIFFSQATVASKQSWIGNQLGFTRSFGFLLYRSGGFNLDIPGDSRYDWRDLFVSKLPDEGFTPDHGHVGWQKTLNFTFFNINEHYDATPTGTQTSRAFGHLLPGSSCSIQSIWPNTFGGIVTISVSWRSIE
ncbi:hypothetical protein BDV30DRAFT_109420 [Aspergillus minisclerotigenes]|uniref:Uncharacterized protein n=1 Tax=Aspergillus minisclerotigenes TaxID=656917 RepID=A0A5N6J788_9EURO|nr:hypothetical protein BDV30DRAFT_109420 [Aspergillus minisclerotigenes]